MTVSASSFLHQPINPVWIVTHTSESCLVIMEEMQILVKMYTFLSSPLATAVENWVMGNLTRAIWTHLEPWCSQTEEQRVDAAETHRLLVPKEHFPACVINTGSITASKFYMHLDCLITKIISLPDVQRRDTVLPHPNPGAAVTRSGRASTEFEQICLVKTITPGW